jgi:hypothetical protein
LFAAAFWIVSLPATAPAAADERQGDGQERWGVDPDQAEELRGLMEQALRHLEDRLKDTLESIPLYDLPEITEEGDIIIRRLPPLDLDRDRPSATKIWIRTSPRSAFDLGGLQAL